MANDCFEFKWMGTMMMNNVNNNVNNESRKMIEVPWHDEQMHPQHKRLCESKSADILLHGYNENRRMGLCEEQMQKDITEVRLKVMLKSMESLVW